MDQQSPITTGSAAAHWIGGAWRPEGDVAEALDPATGLGAARHHVGSIVLADEAVAVAAKSFASGGWSGKPRLRQAVLLEAADRFTAHAPEIMDALVRETGKRRVEAEGEVRALVSEFRYYAGLARTIQGRITEIDEGQISYLHREAAGVAAIIVPWNAPVALLARSLAPAMAAGCTSVVKPAPQTAGVNTIIARCLAEIRDMPAGVVNTVNERGSEVGRALVAARDVDVVSFTGSTATGKAIMAAAAGTLKKLSLELGGKAPSLVFADVDLERAVPEIVRGIVPISGQMCIAIGRVLVQESVADVVGQRLVAALKALRIGPGHDPATELAPLIDVANRQRILDLIGRAGQHGELLLRGEAVEPGGVKGGAYVSPSIVRTDETGSFLVQDELFGPIVTLEGFRDEAHAVELANATRYGLAASVFTTDGDCAQRVSRGLRTGSVWINAHNRLFPEVETGGYRESGLGRLHRIEGLNDFLETKAVFRDSGWP